jgi:chemotaxis protein histidine kinase CheA
MNMPAGTPDEESDNDVSLSRIDWIAFKETCTGLDIDSGIKRFGGSDEAYLDVLKSFAVNTRRLLDKIAVFNPEALHDYEITVHGIKGSGRGICADKVADAAEALENAAKDADLGFITANNDALVILVRALVDDIDKAILQMQEDNPKPLKDRPDKEVLAKLKEACESFDMDGIDEAVAELEAFDYENDGNLAKEIIEKASLFDHEGIIKLIGGEA